MQILGFDGILFHVLKDLVVLSLNEVLVALIYNFVHRIVLVLELFR